MIPRRKTREETRSANAERLLEAGRQVFLAKGFHAASLDEVSAAAGLTKGAVYARFASKAELFMALLERHIDERLGEIRRSVGAARTPAEAARSMARQWMRRTASNSDWSLLTLEFRVHVARDPAQLRAYRALHDRLRRGIAELLTAFYTRAGVAPPYAPEVMARLSLALGNGLALERWAEDGGQHAGLLEQLLVSLSEGRLLPKGDAP